MDATCPSLTDKQKEALYKVNMDNTFGLIVKNDFAPEKNLLSKKAFDIAEHTSLQPAKKAYKENISLKEACVSLGFLTAERFDEVFHPENMI